MLSGRWAKAQFPAQHQMYTGRTHHCLTCTYFLYQTPIAQEPAPGRRFPLVKKLQNWYTEKAVQDFLLRGIGVLSRLQALGSCHSWGLPHILFAYREV